MPPRVGVVGVESQREAATREGDKGGIYGGLKLLIVFLPTQKRNKVSIGKDLGKYEKRHVLQNAGTVLTWNHFKVYFGAWPSQHRFHSLGCPPGPGGWAAGRWCDLRVRTCSSYNWRAEGIRAGTLETPAFPATSRRLSGRAGAAGDWGEDGWWMGERKKGLLQAKIIIPYITHRYVMNKSIGKQKCKPTLIETLWPDQISSHK